MTVEEVIRKKDVPTGEGYLIPGALMHRLIIAVILAIISIGGYMAAWALADADFKARVLTRLTTVEDLVDLHDTYRRQSDESVQRLHNVEDDLEDHINQGH